MVESDIKPPVRVKKHHVKFCRKGADMAEQDAKSLPLVYWIGSRAERASVIRAHRTAGQAIADGVAQIIDNDAGPDVICDACLAPDSHCPSKDSKVARITQDSVHRKNIFERIKRDLRYKHEMPFDDKMKLIDEYLR